VASLSFPQRRESRNVFMFESPLARGQRLDAVPMQVSGVRFRVSVSGPEGLPGGFKGNGMEAMPERFLVSLC